MHFQPNQDEWFYVIDGKYLFQVGEDKYQIKSGNTIFLPCNIQHAFVQLTEKVKMIVSYLLTGKMEKFFEMADSRTSPPSKVEIEKVFADHDMRIVGPPLKI